LENLIKLLIITIEKSIKQTQIQKMSTTTTKSTNPTLFSYNDITIYQVDYDSMQPGYWLTDNCISLWIEWIKEHENVSNIAIIDPAQSFALLYLPSQDLVGGGNPLQNIYYKASLPSCQYIAIFVNNSSNPDQSGSGSHWSLLVINKTNQTSIHYDSCSGFNTQVAKEYHNAIIHLIQTSTTTTVATTTTTVATTTTTKFKFIDESNLEKQPNAWDCGCFAISFLHRIINPNQYLLPNEVRNALIHIVKDKM
jgi:sentrin-specific protease 8